MSKKDALIKAAQSKVREGGYNNFSFRELADEVGIKSASVHYHFPTKSDLGAELARRYTDDFLLALGDADALYQQGKDPIQSYVDMFRSALKHDKKMCLCGLLGAESDILPSKVKDETKRFFTLNLQWLTRAYYITLKNKLTHSRTKEDNEQEAAALAARTLALLEGAILISNTMADDSLFEKAVAHL